jgi:hypothetical protein
MMRNQLDFLKGFLKKQFENIIYLIVVKKIQE